MQQVIAVVNHKGGVGKTTSTVNIAACWGEIGKRVLVIDLDPQGSASLSFGIDDDGNALFQALQKTTALPVLSTKARGVDLVPTGRGFAEARQRFFGAVGSELLMRCLRYTEGEWDFVIIDCPPSLDILTTTALKASAHVVIPVEANYLSYHGLSEMIQSVSKFKSQNPVLAVRENVSLAEAPGNGLPVVLYYPNSNGAYDYRRVAQWLLERLSIVRNLHFNPFPVVSNTEFSL